MVKNKTVRFLYFREDNLYYITECDFTFRVPISDVGTASMNAEDKAILFMRWINKEIKLVKEIDKLRKDHQSKLEDDYDLVKNRCLLPELPMA